jgi:hypothetical protein
MKSSIIKISLVTFSLAGLLAFSQTQSVITGNIVPADGAESVWAFSGTDSARAVILNTGIFSLTVKPGIYKLVIDGKTPYKDVILENVDVKQGRPLDVGQIILQR